MNTWVWVLVLLLYQLDFLVVCGEFSTKADKKKLEIFTRNDNSPVRNGDLEFVMEGKREFLRAFIEFAKESDDGDVDGAVLNQMKLLLVQVIEFVPAGGTGFQGETPESVYPANGGDWEWDNVVKQSNNVFTMSTKDGVFSVILRYFPDKDVDTFKMDFAIFDFPFKTPGNSKLAFLCQAKAKASQVDVRDQQSEVRTDFQGSFVQGALGWVTQVEITSSDGNTSVVPLTFTEGQPDEDGEGIGVNVFFTVETTDPFSELLWDPSLLAVGDGVGLDANQQGGPEIDVPLIVGGIIGALAIFFLLTAFFNKSGAGNWQNSDDPSAFYNHLKKQFPDLAKYRPNISIRPQYHHNNNTHLAYKL